MLFSFIHLKTVVLSYIYIYIEFVGNNLKDRHCRHLFVNSISYKIVTAIQHAEASDASGLPTEISRVYNAVIGSTGMSSFQMA